ncbi:MAG TPA: hypothetical protein VIP11_16975, partial [Gemmatimonadaceae bacterium]
LKLHGVVDRANQARPGVTTFNSVRLNAVLWGVTPTQAAELVEGFKARCPLFGTLRVATPDVQVHFTVGT